MRRRWLLPWMTAGFCTGGTLVAIYRREPGWTMYYLSVMAFILQVDRASHRIGNMTVLDAKRYKARVEKETGMKVVVLINVSSLAVVETEEER